MDDITYYEALIQNIEIITNTSNLNTNIYDPNCDITKFGFIVPTMQDREFIFKLKYEFGNMYVIQYKTDIATFLCNFRDDIKIKNVILHYIHGYIFRDENPIPFNDIVSNNQIKNK